MFSNHDCVTRLSRQHSSWLSFLDNDSQTTRHSPDGICQTSSSSSTSLFSICSSLLVRPLQSFLELVTSPHAPSRMLHKDLFLLLLHLLLQLYPIAIPKCRQSRVVLQSLWLLPADAIVSLVPDDTRPTLTRPLCA